MQDSKTVLLGVSGCIAAYKSCEIVRGLQKAGLRVKVVMTEHASHFVDPLSFRALTNETVGIGLFDDPQDPIHHISLAQEANLFLIAPCTANVLAKIAHGIADDLLTTTALATTAPILIAPAMNVHMYENRITQKNIQILKDYEVEFVEPDAGYLACGDIGRGRLAEPEEIVSAVLKRLQVQDTSSIDHPDSSAEDTAPISCEAISSKIAANRKDLIGKRVMITAGPTVEPIDPVRYITNRSSGKFGYALAQAALDRGAEVTLISGPVALDVPAGVSLIRVETALEMLESTQTVFEDCDYALFAAAVADVRPAQQKAIKLKKGVDDDALKAIELTENPDILATCGSLKNHQVVVGFAAETNDVLENARKKLQKKNADMIVANEVGAHKAFGKDEDEIWLVTAQTEEHFDLLPKRELAHIILDEMQKL